MNTSLNQQSLFDEPAGPPTERRPPAVQHHDEDASGVAEYMRRKDREEQEERQQGNDLHGQATAGASAVYLLRWALSGVEPKEDEPALPDEARKEAHRCKARLDALERARMTTDPTAEDFVSLRDSAHDAWPFDDDPMEVPHSSTDRADYEAYLASEWKTRWRHVVPTRIIKEAKDADPSFL